MMCSSSILNKLLQNKCHAVLLCPSKVAQFTELDLSTRFSWLARVLMKIDPN
jgi:hypothetical protein